MSANMYYDRHLQGTPFRRRPQADEQARFERMHLRLLTEMSLNRFKWIGLPPEISPRFLELNMFYNAFSLFFYDKRFDKFMVTKARSSGRLNLYDDPTRFRAFAVNYPSVDVLTYKGTQHTGIGIPIWSNYLRMPDTDIVQIYAKRLANLDRTLDINTENARLTKFVVSNERQRLSMDNISRDIEQGSNNIKVTGGMPGELDNIKVLDLGVDPDHIEKLDIVKVRRFNEACGLLGIKNANQDKKERLVEAEVSANDDQIMSIRYVNLQARQEACQRINDVYGLDVWVEYNTEVDSMISIPTFAEEGLEEEGFELEHPFVEDLTAGNDSPKEIGA